MGDKGEVKEGGGKGARGWEKEGTAMARVAKEGWAVGGRRIQGRCCLLMQSLWT